jgi:phosphatidylinositol 3-kinase
MKVKSERNTDTGMIQFIPSRALANILSEHPTISFYLKSLHPDEKALDTFGIIPLVMDTYIKSCGKEKNRD